MPWDQTTKLVQFAAAALAIPAGAAGVYTVYRSHFSTEGACDALRAAIITTMEKNVPAEAKRALLRKDVDAFERKCGSLDPDARAIFLAAVQPLPETRPPMTPVAASAPGAAPVATTPRPSALATPPAAASAMSMTPVTAPPGAARPLLDPPPAPAPRAVPQPGPAPRAVPQPGLTAHAVPQPGSGAGPVGVIPDRRGWVVLARRNAARYADVNFDGYAISPSALPPAGTVLKARWPVQIWRHPSEPAPADTLTVVGTMRAGACARVVVAQAGPQRLWAEVTPAPCS